MTGPDLRAMVAGVLRRYDDPMLEFEERDRVSDILALWERPEVIEAMAREIVSSDGLIVVNGTMLKDAVRSAIHAMTRGG